MKLLIVEDQESVRVLAASLLRERGHEVREAATVDDALTALDAGLPDAVLLDLSLGQPSAGLHARLRSLALPVLVVSGLDDDDAQHAASSQGWSLLLKPFDPERLIAMVDRLAPPPPPAPVLPPPPTERPPLDGLSSAPAAAHDPMRDRLRVVLDRAIYAGALLAVVMLAREGKLDLQTLAAILLVAGVRPHNLFEMARGGGGRNAMLLPILLHNIRGGTWLAR